MAILSAVCVALAAICAALTLAWSRERDRADCWATAAEFDLAPAAACADRGYGEALQDARARR